ncbi:GNAT family N-acetyltransferase [Enemella sp. A6]|uniref:GNAT family N-acetyltransferase n=1 Tax=Enemella sp. A6 TaxID=3440152 RepID=UPI003EB8D79D
MLPQNPFVPDGFLPPTSLVTDRFVLTPLGPEHNEGDHAAWMSSIDHIRRTSGYPDGNWPPEEGMSLEENLADLVRHSADFEAGKGFTFTVLDAPDGEVIGCVYLYPPEGRGDVIVQSWVRVDRAELDQPLADAVAQWLKDAWPWQNPDRCGRPDN